MTVKEYLTQQLSKFGVTDNDIDIILLENNLNADDQVTTAEQTLVIKRALFFWLPGMIAGLSDISEGGYSIKWNAAGLKAWISALAKLLNLPDPFAVDNAVVKAKRTW